MAEAGEIPDTVATYGYYYQGHVEDGVTIFLRHCMSIVPASA